MALSFLVEDVAVGDDKPKLDIVGIVLAAIGLIMVIVGTLKMPVWGMFSPVTNFAVMGLSPALVMILVGLAILAVLLVWEKSYEAKGGLALMPAKIVYNKQVQAGLYLGGLFWVGSAAPVTISVPYMQLVGGTSAAQAGMSVMGMAIATVAMLLPVKMSHLKVRTVSTFGLVGAAVSAVIMSFGLTLEGHNALIYIGHTLMGCSIGAMASQCSIIVTDALPPREAQQSGGIQATARNIGYAVGIAVMGVSMLIMMTSDYKSQVQQATEISASSQEMIESMPAVPFRGDDSFSTLMVEKGVSEQEVTTLVEINKSTRLKAARTGLYAVALMMLFFLFSIRHLPKRSLMMKKEEIDTDSDKAGASA